MISVEEIEKLAELSRIALSTEEKVALQKDMASILEYVDQIKSVSAADMSQRKVGNVRNVLREDKEFHQGGVFSEALISAAPNRKGDYVKVKKIL